MTDYFKEVISHQVGRLLSLNMQNQTLCWLSLLARTSILELILVFGNKWRGFECTIVNEISRSTIPFDNCMLGKKRLVTHENVNDTRQEIALAVPSRWPAHVDAAQFWQQYIENGKPFKIMSFLEDLQAVEALPKCWYNSPNTEKWLL